jgi:phosphoglycerate kinase
MAYPEITGAEVSGKRVFVRADLNVPIENGVVMDDTRIEGILPTVRLLVDRGASVILASHLGRPDGKPDIRYSLRPVALRLQELLGARVSFAPDCVGSRVETLVAALRPGDVMLLENLRFHPEEEAGDQGFADSLASLADVFVNDAFGTCHREHASMTGVPRAMGGGYAGLLVMRELEMFSGMLEHPAKPFTLLLGGAKVSDKVPVIENLIGRLDSILIGGGMAFTFMKAMGMEIGLSILEEDRIATAADILRKAKEAGVKVLLPEDIVIAPSPDMAVEARTVRADSIPEGMKGLDVGPLTVRAFSRVILESGTVVWNGPMGLFEIPPFNVATLEMAGAMAQATLKGAVTVIGGGDSVRAVTEAGLADSVTFVSTGGGASLRLLQGKALPALAALGDGHR